ncbi:serine/threonine-protein kinase [Streptomyces sp. NPDC020096]
MGAAQKVRGAHLAPLLDADPRAERPWLATTYVAGPSLRDLVVEHGYLPTGQVILLAWGIAQALADIHAAKVVHRDLKPGNIILDESGPKVIDFGIVKSLAQSVTYSSHSTRIGTPLYMSPEQAAGHAVGAPSDVFALGSTLYFLASSREAFAAENEWAVAHRVVADTPDLSAIDLPLRRLITACLHKDPDQRPTPVDVQTWCEKELGVALGPGAWMGITGAREAIQQHTSALRALTAPAPAPASGQTRSTQLDPGTSANPGPSSEGEATPTEAMGGEPVAIASGRKATVRHQAQNGAQFGGGLFAVIGACTGAGFKHDGTAFLMLNANSSWLAYLFIGAAIFGGSAYYLFWLIVAFHARSPELDSLTVSPGGMTVVGDNKLRVYKWSDLTAVRLQQPGSGEVVVNATPREKRTSDGRSQSGPVRDSEQPRIVAFHGRGIAGNDTARVTAALHRYAGSLYQGPTGLP